MGYLTFNTRSNRFVIISSVITTIFNSVQYRNSHISTCFNKDTRDLFMLCILCLCRLYIRYRYSLIIYLCSLFVVVVHLFCSLFDSLFVLLFDFIFHRFFCFYSLFIVSKIRVNKHHTADSTDFVLV